MADRTALNMNELENVSGGSYVSVSMSIGEIIETDHNLAGMLAQAGIPAVGNKSVLGMSLYEIASVRGIDPYSLENKMNDYLSSK